MTPAAARNELYYVTTGARELREKLATDLGAIAKSNAWSDAHKAKVTAETRATAAEALARLQRRADTAAEALAAYRPGPAANPGHDAKVGRAAARMNQLLDAGAGVGEVLALAASSRDTALVDAVREAAPTLVAIEAHRNGTQDSAADRLAEIHQNADRAMAQAMAGTQAGADATTALLGRASARLAAHELTAAQAAAEGRHLDKLGHAIEGQYAQQEYDRVAAELAAPGA